MSHGVNDKESADLANRQFARYAVGVRFRVVILVADGFTDSGLSIALDILRTANAIAVHAGRAAPFAIDVASARGGSVRAASGMELTATAQLSYATRAAAVLVPGIWAEDAREIDAALERAAVRTLIAAIVKAHARGALIGSSCAGAFLLAEAGLLDGRECTTTWWLAPHLQKRRPAARVSAERALVVDGRVISAGAVFAQADLALHLVTRVAGPATARLCSRLLLLDAHSSQAPYMAINQLTTNDEVVCRAEAWVRRHLAEDFAIATLGRAVGVSPRTLARRLTAAVGLSPIGFVQRLRVEAAVHLLETTRLSVEEISARVGYRDANTLRRLVRRETKSSPRELRAK